MGRLASDLRAAVALRRQIGRVRRATPAASPGANGDAADRASAQALARGLRAGSPLSRSRPLFDAESVPAEGDPALPAWVAFTGGSLAAGVLRDRVHRGERLRATEADALLLTCAHYGGALALPRARELLARREPKGLLAAHHMACYVVEAHGHPLDAATDAALLRELGRWAGVEVSPAMESRLPDMAKAREERRLARPGEVVVAADPT